MHSIRNKIQSLLIISIVIVAICAFGVLYVNQQSVTQNQKIIDRMTAEYSIMSQTDNLISSFNDATKSPNDAATQAIYQANRVKILNTLADLKKQTYSNDISASLVGVENTVDSVIVETDNGLKELANNNFGDISVHFSQANVNNDFVRQDTQILIQKELDYLVNTQANTKNLYQISVFVSVGLFCLVLVIVVIYGSLFSKQLVQPIEKLSVAAKEIAAGNMEVTMDNTLLDQKDEVGTLSDSFKTMVETIKAKITELNKSKMALENSNEELGKLNSYMVGREMKMVELKGKISELEKTKK
jgi:nitrogen fixation/metabolism regulation signal transduction histidine kinase